MFYVKIIAVKGKISVLSAFPPMTFYFINKTFRMKVNINTLPNPFMKKKPFFLAKFYLYQRMHFFLSYTKIT